MVNFRLELPATVLFGAGEAPRSLPLVREMGTRVLVVGGSSPERIRWALDGLADLGARTGTVSVSGEPRVGDLVEAVARAREFGAECVVGIGGGSVLDMAKAVGALAAGGGDPLDHLEVVGKGLPLPGIGLPIAAYPTTAGTGAEATRNAVFSTGSVKVSLRGPGLLPSISVVDPNLCAGLPREATAWCAMDALTQLIEPLVSRFSNPACDALCREAIPRLARALPAALEDPGCASARADLSLAALFSGIALANSRLGAVHGLAGPLGGRIPAPHGALCARLLPFVWDENVAALREAGDGRFLPRFLEVARLLAGARDATPEDGSRILHALSSSSGAPGLSSWGLSGADIPAVRADALWASSMKGNPIDLHPDRIEAVLSRAL